jgi:hypothetical protein
MIDETVKTNFMERLKRKSSPRFPRNVFKEYLFTERSVRYLMECYHSGEMTSSDIYMRLGETAGLFLIALSEGYNIKDVARTAKIAPKEIRRTVLNACKRAKIMGLIPDIDDSFNGEEVSRIAPEH